MVMTAIDPIAADLIALVMFSRLSVNQCGRME